MNLLIDVGYTAIKAAWADGITLGKTFRYQGERTADFILGLVEKNRPDVMVLSSVREFSQTAISKFGKCCGKFILIDSEHNFILEDNALPAYLTPDRAASVIAAQYLFKGKGCTIFDFGTILTIDFMDAEGHYSGGNISLGCRTRFKSVNRYSKSLPLQDTPENVEETGNSLTSSIDSGIILGIMFEIGGYFARHPENIVIFTGGDAIYFAKRMKNSIFVVCNLVLMGLALIAVRYGEK